MHRPTSEINEPPAVFSGPKRLPEENKSKIILVVDDDPDTVDLVSSIGRKAGYMVLGATSGEECLSMLFRVTPQLILLDVKMTGLDGFEICRRVRSDPNVARVPIAFLTARKTVEDVRRGLAVGADDFIVKPFLATKLLERIEFLTTNNQLLRRRRKRRSPDFNAPEDTEVETVGTTAPPPPEDGTVRTSETPAEGGATAAAIPRVAQGDASRTNAMATAPQRCTLQQIAALPLAPFLVAEGHRRAPGVISEAVLPIWWDALIAIADDHLKVIQGELDRLISTSDTIGLEALNRTLLGVVATLTSRLAEMLQDPRSTHPPSVKALVRLGATPDMKLITEILLVARPLHEAIKTFNRAQPHESDSKPSIAELTPPLVIEAKQCYAKIGDGGVAGRLFVVAVLNCLEKPWQIFRLVRALSRNRDASVVSGTELGVIGDRLIFDIDTVVSAIDTATAKLRMRAASADLEKILALIALYADTNEGFLTEIDIRRDSLWGVALLRARARMGNALDESRLRSVADAILAPLEEQQGSPAAIDKAGLAIRFLTFVAQRGERHGFATPARRLLKTVREKIAGLIDAALDELRSNPIDGVMPAYLHQAIKLVEVVFEDYQGQALGNRLKLALSAADQHTSN